MSSCREGRHRGSYLLLSAEDLRLSGGGVGARRDGGRLYGTLNRHSAHLEKLHNFARRADIRQAGVFSRFVRVTPRTTLDRTVDWTRLSEWATEAVACRDGRIRV